MKTNIKTGTPEFLRMVEEATEKKREYPLKYLGYYQGREYYCEDSPTTYIIGYPVFYAVDDNGVTVLDFDEMFEIMDAIADFRDGKFSKSKDLYFVL